MNEAQLFEWWQKERNSNDIVKVPPEADEELLEMFKEKDQKERERLVKIYEKILDVRTRKIVNTARVSAYTEGVILNTDVPRERKLYHEIRECIKETRDAILPFLERKDET